MVYLLESPQFQGNKSIYSQASFVGDIVKHTHTHVPYLSPALVMLFCMIIVYIAYYIIISFEAF